METIHALADNQDRHYTRVKLDAYHWFSRITTFVDKDHGAYLDFCRELRDAVFVLNEDDKKRVDEFLKQSDRCFDNEMDENPKWVLKFVRRVIPNPSSLCERLDLVYDKFKDAFDSTTKDYLFQSNFVGVWTKAMMHARNGCLSDPPGIPLYHAIKKLKNGLTQWRCVRGTNSNEGSVHQKLRSSFGAYNAGPKLTLCMLLDFAARLNMKAAVRNMRHHDYGHFDPWLLDEITKVREAIDDQMEYADWIPTYQIQLSPLPMFVIGPIFEDGRYPEFDVEFAKGMRPSMKFLASKMNLKVPLAPIHTKDEMKLYKSLSNDPLSMLANFNAHADGKTIFFKTQALLDKHRKSRTSAINRYATRRENDLTVKQQPTVIPEFSAPFLAPVIHVVPTQIQVPTASLEVESTVVPTVIEGQTASSQEEYTFQYLNDLVNEHIEPDVNDFNEGDVSYNFGDSVFDFETSDVVFASLRDTAWQEELEERHRNGQGASGSGGVNSIRETRTQFLEVLNDGDVNQESSAE